MSIGWHKFCTGAEIWDLKRNDKIKCSLIQDNYVTKKVQMKLGIFIQYRLNPKVNVKIDQCFIVISSSMHRQSHLGDLEE